MICPVCGEEMDNWNDKWGGELYHILETASCGKYVQEYTYNIKPQNCPKCSTWINNSEIKMYKFWMLIPITELVS